MAFCGVYKKLEVLDFLCYLAQKLEEDCSND